MAASIQKAVPGVEVQLVRGGKGDFIVTAGSRELWNKRASGMGFPDHQLIVQELASG